jgi:hypothetical protein
MKEDYRNEELYLDKKTLYKLAGILGMDNVVVEQEEEEKKEEEPIGMYSELFKNNK